jgi:hypothetical protein
MSGLIVEELRLLALKRAEELEIHANWKVPAVDRCG